MEYIKSMLSAFFSMMIDWVLACEIKRKKSRNINGAITRQMRECLIKLYCTIKEIQTQRENAESEKLQVEEMKRRMEEIQEENVSLRKELEQVKSKINPLTPSASRKRDGSAQTPKSSAKENKKDGKKESGNDKTMRGTKRNSQLVITPLERRRKNLRIRRELSLTLLMPEDLI